MNNQVVVRLAKNEKPWQGIQATHYRGFLHLVIAVLFLLVDFLPVAFHFALGLLTDLATFLNGAPAVAGTLLGAGESIPLRTLAPLAFSASIKWVTFRPGRRTQNPCESTPPAATQKVSHR